MTRMTAGDAPPWIIWIFTHRNQFTAFVGIVVGVVPVSAAIDASIVVPAKHGGPEPISVSAAGVAAFCRAAALLVGALVLLRLVAFALAACYCGGAAA